MEVARRNKDGMKSVFDRLGPINVAAAVTKKLKVCHYYQSGKCYRKNFLHCNLFEDGIPNGKGNKRGRQQLLDRHQNHHTPVLMKPRNLDHVLNFNGSQDSLAASKNVSQLSVSKARTVSTRRKSSTITDTGPKTVMRPSTNCLKSPTHTDSALKSILKSVSPPKAPPSPVRSSKNCMTNACGLKNDSSSYTGMGQTLKTPACAFMTSCELASESSMALAAKSAMKICEQWAEGNCLYGEKCKYMHSWFSGKDYTLAASLDGHRKSITGIALPVGSDKLYSGSKDGTLRVWDCYNGQCVGVINMEGEIGCLISEGAWIFIGIPNMVKVLNVESNIHVSLPGPDGQVYSLGISDNIIFAGTQDGSIWVWRFNDAGTNIDAPAPLLGHGLAVVTLVVGAGRLYSGSLDNTIKVWDITTLSCLFTLTDHTSPVACVLCFDCYLLSCSLDNKIKVWSTVEDGALKVVHTHNEEHGLLGLCGTYDSKGVPIALCSCNDKSVKLYSLPLFSERGRTFSRGEVRSLRAAPGGLFFTGDEAGQIKVWRWLSKEIAQPISTM